MQGACLFTACAAIGVGYAVSKTPIRFSDIFEFKMNQSDDEIIKFGRRLLRASPNFRTFWLEL